MYSFKRLPAEYFTKFETLKTAPYSAGYIYATKQITDGCNDCGRFRKQLDVLIEAFYDDKNRLDPTNGIVKFKYYCCKGFIWLMQPKPRSKNLYIFGDGFQDSLNWEYIQDREDSADYPDCR